MNTHRLIYCSLWARYFVYFDVWLVYVLKRTGPVSLGCIVDRCLCQPFVDLVHGRVCWLLLPQIHITFTLFPFIQSNLSSDFSAAESLAMNTFVSSDV